MKFFDQTCSTLSLKKLLVIAIIVHIILILLVLPAGAATKVANPPAKESVSFFCHNKQEVKIYIRENWAFLEYKGEEYILFPSKAGNRAIFLSPATSESIYIDKSRSYVTLRHAKSVEMGFKNLYDEVYQCR